MKDSFAFHTPDMDQYVRLLMHMFSDSSLFAIVDPAGETHWQSENDSSGVLDRFLAGIANREVSLDEDIFHHCHRDHFLLIRQMDLDFLETPLYFIGMIPKKSLANPLTDANHSFFKDVVDLFCLHADLEAENKNMAIELAQRYEELTLIYKADERSKETLDIQQNLDNVLADITELTDVGAAFLWIPEMNYWMFHSCEKTVSKEAETTLKKAVENQWNQVEQINQSRVFNTPVFNQFRMILSPIHDLNRQMIGVIGCTRPAAGQEFQTGDRRLIEAISQRAKKIILNKLDTLTGLINRSGFELRLKELLAAPIENKIQNTVAFINIDQFKLLNDAYGLDAGDAVLTKTARILSTHLRHRDFLARTEGDEFVVILSDMKTETHFLDILDRIRHTIAGQIYEFNGKTFSVTIRIGLVHLTPEITALSEVVSKAAIALEEAKEKGGNSMSVFREGDLRYIEKKDHAGYATRIESLLKKNQFFLFCQPIIPLQGGRLHYEILIRLRGEDQTIVPPVKFLPAAERYNKMPLIDKWVIRQTCEAVTRSMGFLEKDPVTWAINLSGQSLKDESFINFFLSFISRIPFPPSWLSFEITETVAILNFSKVIHVIDQMLNMGFSVSLDDFGTGYSSFEYLKKLPVSFLKIDGAFVKNLHIDAFDQVTVQSIAAIARYLKIQTIAEFVENQDILELLKQFGIDYAQGYHTGKPRDFLDTLKDLDGDRKTGQPSMEF